MTAKQKMRTLEISFIRRFRNGFCDGDGLNRTKQTATLISQQKTEKYIIRGDHNANQNKLSQSDLYQISLMVGL